MKWLKTTSFKDQAISYMSLLVGYITWKFMCASISFEIQYVRKVGKYIKRKHDLIDDQLGVA